MSADAKVAMEERFQQFRTREVECRSREADDEPRPLDLIWADDIKLDLAKPGLIDGLWDTTALILTFGDSGVGKTFVAVDRACRIAAGMEWHGYATTEGVVVYVAAENYESVERRIWAWKKHHEVGKLPLILLRSKVNLLRSGDVTSIIEALKKITKKRIKLIVIDTLARSMMGNENSAEDMGGYVAACDQLREEFSCAINIIHHSGKDQARGARGSSALRAAIDLEEEVTEGLIYVDKARDEEDGCGFGFELKTIELGKNALNRMVTTCVAIEGEAPARGEGKVLLGPNEKIALKALDAAMMDHANEHGRVHLKVWREETEKRLSHETPKQRWRAFTSAVTSLTAKRQVDVYDDYASPRE